VPTFEREPEPMRRHRTTARGLLLAAAIGALAAPAAAAPPAAAPIVFPVVGPVTYQDDFGQPRAGGPHQGNDILAPRKAIAVAAESGTVKLWTTSASAGCMLYLYGDSGTMYEYIHLNNDVGSGNDNKGKCVAGTAYAPGLKSGARVQAGQQVGFVGDSGDANGIHPHLHFEVHPKGGKATDPYPYLQAATPLLFYAKPGTPFSLALTGTVVTASDTQLQIQLSSLQAWPSKLTQTKLTRTLTVAVPATATIRQSGAPGAARLLSAYTGQPVVVWTLPAFATLKAERGDDGALSAALVDLG
jgi:Peptidase family M23